MRKRCGLAIASGLMLVVGLAILSGCAAQRGASPELVSKSGFLRQSVYAKMRDGDPKQFEPAKVYRNDAALRAGKYDKIMLDPIVVFANPYKKEDPEVTPEDTQTVVNYFHYALVESIKESKFMTLTEKPGPQTIRISLAITDLEASDVGMDTVSTYIPQARMLASIGTMAREKPAFVGQLAIEGKMVDAHTGQLLAAMVDKRYGGKYWGKDVDEWADVRAIIDYYVEVLEWRACTFRALPDCEKPGEGPEEPPPPLTDKG